MANEGKSRSLDSGSGIEILGLSEQDKKQLFEWNSTPIEEVDRCIHDVIHDQIISKPAAEAIVFENERFSYEELDQLSSRLSAYLMDLGIGIGTFVPLCFDHSASYVIAMLATLKSGAAFVPLDFATPITRLQALVESIGATILLCSPQHLHSLSSVASTIVPVDSKMMIQLSHMTHPQDIPSVTGANQAYLI